MVAATIDVAGIGNAIVDVIAHADESFLASEGFAKGSMTLIDAARADALYAKIGPAIESSGGSAGNTMAGIASLGGKGAYIGKVRDDLLGAGFPSRHHRDRHPFRDAAGERGAGHGALPGAGDRGWAAHDGHLSRRLRRSRSRGYRPGDRRGGADHLSRGLSVRPAARQGSLSQGRAGRPPGRPPGGAEPVRPVLRRPSSR